MQYKLLEMVLDLKSNAYSLDLTKSILDAKTYKTYYFFSEGWRC